jgi:hypothetical protein
MNHIFFYITLVSSFFFKAGAFSHRYITNEPRRNFETCLTDQSLCRQYQASTIALASSTTALHLFGKSQDTTTKTAITDQDVLVVDIDETKEESNQTAILRFGGKNTYTSSTIPMPSDVQQIHNFFAKPENQKVLLAGRRDGTSEMEELDMSEIDSEKWVENARIMGGDKPDFAKDRVVQITPKGIGILTVEVCPLSIIGIKVTSAKSQGGEPPMPEFQTVLIHDYPRAKGPKPLVWLFNKIVYGGDPNNENKTFKQRRRDEKAMLRFWAERLPSNFNSTGETFVFKAETELFLEFEFPRLLLRFFPLSKDKAEEIVR